MGISTLPNCLDGIPVFHNSYLDNPSIEIERVQYRFPRSKKKRIRRKWAKRPSNWREELGQVVDAVLVSDPVRPWQGTIYASADFLDAMKARNRKAEGHLNVMKLPCGLPATEGLSRSLTSQIGVCGDLVRHKDKLPEAPQ